MKNSFDRLDLNQNKIGTSTFPSFNHFTNKHLSPKNMKANGIYIYGIVPNFYGTDMFRSLENSGVYPVSFQNISALVSDTINSHLDYSDRESLGHLLVHHQRTIEDLMYKGFNMILPMRLGTIVSSNHDRQRHGEVIKILENGYDLIIETLNKIEHLTEIDLVVTWDDFTGILKEISENPEILSMKDNIQNKSGRLTQADQVKMGMLVQSKLKEKNTKVEINVLDRLASLCVDIKIHDVMNDQMIINSAFLINKNNKENFEQQIVRIDEEYNGKLNFKLVGPLPCYSFYTLEAKELDPENIAIARQDLGLKEETTESEIKKAYLEKVKQFHPDLQHDNNDDENFNRINKAYHNVLDYSAAVRQSSKEGFISLSKDIVVGNMILIKIKE